MYKADQIIEKLLHFEDKLLSEYYSDEEYREMLFTAGISEREYDILQTALTDYLDRARQFTKRNLFEDTLKQLKTAQIISPNNYDVNLGLANVYFEYWQKTSENSFQKMAERHIEFCLNINPKDEAAADLLELLRSTKPAINESLKSKSPTTANRFFKWLLKRDKKGEYSRLYLCVATSIIVAFLLLYIIPVSIMDSISADRAQKLSVELEKKYELINKYIQNNEIDKAQNELLKLVHPSKEYTEIYPKGFSIEPYTYNEYWKIKRAELNKKIEIKIRIVESNKINN